jgi:hypothetical protein
MNTLNLRPSPDLGWMPGTSGLLLVHSGGGTCHRLEYPEAAIWDFFTRGYNLSRVAALLRYIGGFADESAAARYASERLWDWRRQGWIITVQEVPAHVED